MCAVKRAAVQSGETKKTNGINGNVCSSGKQNSFHKKKNHRRSACLAAATLLPSSPQFVPFWIASPYQTSTVCIQVCVILHCIALHYWISLFSVSLLGAFFFLSFFVYILSVCRCDCIVAMKINCMSWIYYLVSTNTATICCAKVNRIAAKECAPENAQSILHQM